MTWPTFEMLDALDLRPTKDGVPINPMNTTPKFPYEWPEPPILSPLLRSSEFSPLSMLERYRGNCTILDVGVFDGTDWASTSVARGCFTLGFEPVRKNLKLFEEHSGIRSDRYRILAVVPGSSVPSECGKRDCSYHRHDKPGRNSTGAIASFGPVSYT